MDPDPAIPKRSGDPSDRERVVRAATYTLSTQRADGLFLYDFDFLAGAPTGKDNIVRQAGTLFALGEYLLDSGDERVAPAMERGFEALWSRSLPTGKGRAQRILERLGVFAFPSWRLSQWLDRWGLLHWPQGDGRLIADDGRYETAWSGATALALVAELHYFRATGDDRFSEQREAWLRGLLSLYVPRRGVRSHPTTLDEATYFNGEAWLALGYYTETFPEATEVRSVLSRFEDYLLERYDRDREVFFYHWAGMATAVRYRHSEDPRLADFIAEQSAWFLDERPLDEAATDTTCSAVEGLASAAETLKASGGYDAILQQIRRRISVELSRNRTLQIEPGQDRIELPFGGRLTTPTLSEHAGAFRSGLYRAYTRTDLTQHCISAFSKVIRNELGSPRS
jgi:hypothetical protein